MAANLDTSALESEIYWSLKNEVLIELRDLLVDKLQVEKYLSYLRSKRVLDMQDEQDIKAERTDPQKRERFLDILSMKGPNAFDEFCRALQMRGRKGGQEYLLDIILTTFDRKKQEQIHKPPPPANLPSPGEDPKLVVMVTGQTHNTHHVDLNNLPGPGDPGAPMPPDEINTAAGNHSHHAYPTNPPVNSPPPSYEPDLPPPYSE